MTIAQFAIARTFGQLLRKRKLRLITPEEEELAEFLEWQLDRYQTQSDKQEKDSDV